jgi:hypothetical protein
VDKRLRCLIILVTLLLASLACQFAPTSAPEPVSSTAPSRLNYLVGNVLFQDNFSDSSSGWDRLTEASGEANYAGGFYRIYVNKKNTDIWATPGLFFIDVRIDVDATKVGGSDDNNLGVLCRFQNNKNFYELIVSSDGYYSLLKVKDGKQIPLVKDGMQPSEKIRQGGKLNHLRADCIGDSLALFVNGEKIVEVIDTDFATGDVGLIAGAYNTPGTDIRFDNFVVIKP